MTSRSWVLTGLLEHLLTHLTPPRQPGHRGLGHAVAVHGEHSARVLGFLPRVERVYQIKTRPRHLGAWRGATLCERGFHDAQALIKRESGPAPACRDSTAHCSTVGSRQNRNVVCRVITDQRPTAHRHKPWPQDLWAPSISIDDHVTRN